MIIVKILGGLGNQMFQYALYKALKSKGANVVAEIRDCKNYKRHNGYELRRVFNINVDEVSKHDFLSYLNVDEKHIIEQDSFTYHPYVFNTENVLLDGYWQNEQYFINLRKSILLDFGIDKLSGWRNNKNLRLIENTNSVCVHVRRGDYVKKPDAAIVHGNICDLEYYGKAIERMTTLVPNPRFFVFSDDLSWSKKHLNLPGDTIFVRGNSGRNSYKDLILMSRCKHNIIANSSFSWWGAWLNINTNKVVIAPNRWVNDKSLNSGNIVPSGWITINVDK